MHPSHVVEQVPSTWESVSRNRSFTAFPKAKVGIVSMSMESVGLPFVAEQTGVRGETQLGVHAGGNFASVRL